ncbi:Putative protein of unknown function [Podospora comata]|uniref:MYND-type domain-containing protein n=1 Tax=Podospora comata TaxID=48703 RepID=A0ABY6S8R6_PODCO|nr:Putative protein of unknown function [Podospora comata]
MEEKVRSFNSLPGPADMELPNVFGRNHWVFGVCHVGIKNPSDILIAVNPEIDFIKQTSPCQILSMPTTQGKAEATVPHLLDAFLIPEGFNPKATALLPGSWSTLEPEMAQAIEDELKNHGVTPALCKVGMVFREPVKLGDSTRCHGCRMGQASFFEALKRCAQCGRAWYHSRGCQRAYWIVHKETCRAPAATASPAAVFPPKLDAHDYYTTKAPNDPEARDFMKSLCLEDDSKRGGIGLPLYRLIITGQDTPEKMRLLFGPNYGTSLEEQHEEVRLQCLLEPPPGSPAHVMITKMNMNDSCLVRALRPATEDEEGMIAEVRGLQALIQGRVGDWPGILLSYSLAVRTMDQRRFGWWLP